MTSDTLSRQNLNLEDRRRNTVEPFGEFEKHRVKKVDILYLLLYEENSNIILIYSKGIGPPLIYKSLTMSVFSEL